MKIKLFSTANSYLNSNSNRQCALAVPALPLASLNTDEEKGDPTWVGFFVVTYMYTFFCVCMQCAYVGATVYVGSSEDSLWESVLSFHSAGPRHQTGHQARQQAPSTH